MILNAISTFEADARGHTPSELSLPSDFAEHVGTKRGAPKSTITDTQPSWSSAREEPRTIFCSLFALPARGKKNKTAESMCRLCKKMGEGTPCQLQLCEGPANSFKNRREARRLEQGGGSKWMGQRKKKVGKKIASITIMLSPCCAQGPLHGNSRAPRRWRRSTSP